MPQLITKLVVAGLQRQQLPLVVVAVVVNDADEMLVVDLVIALSLEFQYLETQSGREKTKKHKIN